MEMGKIAVFKGPYDLEIRSYPLPDVKDDGMLVKVEAASICGSDGHGIKGTPPRPSSIGHEFTGRIVRMGKNANRSIYAYGGPLREGDRVVPYPWITCGTCPGCLRHGHGVCMICENGFCYGGDRAMGSSPITAAVEDAPHFKGGFAEYVYIFPGTSVWKVPEDMPSDIASILDPTAVAYRAYEMAQADTGSMYEALNANTRAVIIGAGAVGIMAATILRMMGARQVVITDGKDEKLSIAKEVSRADVALNVGNMTSDERVEAVMDLTSGADLVIQCANSSLASLEGLRMVRKLGTYIEVGVPFGFGQTHTINLPQTVFARGARVMALLANSPQTFDKAFGVLGRWRDIPFDKLLTHPFHSLEDLLPTIRKMGDPGYIKGVLKF
jgi:threonine dehydrogenase-like Zn-dependent dehydrogenase